MLSHRPPSAGSSTVIVAILLAAVTTLLTAGGCDFHSPDRVSRLIVLGIDGMDYELTQKLMAEGRMPNFSRLAGEGCFTALGTSVPPLSPVAWSNFITGMDAGGHGIFDFFHRDPKTMLPYFATSQARDAEKTVTVGKWKFPLYGGNVELLRRGTAFWEVLEEHGVETTVLRMPANFPPSRTATWELSGMGTPDLLGTYGTFSFYTTTPTEYRPSVGGGNVYPLRVIDNIGRGQILGPDNPFLVARQKTTIEFVLYLDSQDAVAKFVVGEEERVLHVGEWSDWVPIEFPLIPTQTLRGMCRVYLRRIRPELELYVTPVNVDPHDPALPISHPASYAAELAAATGRFYTQGMPEDTKALTEGVLSPEEFLAQARIAGEEVIEQYRHVLDRFKEGLLFYYFGNLDQVSHLMWRGMDPDHPAYDPEIDGNFRNVVPELYETADRIVGHALNHIGPSTMLIVMSDHGFTSWRRSFHLNGWLKKHEYLAVRKANSVRDPGFLLNVDWSRTRAYGLGLNGLYINLIGRERDGIVDANERDHLIAELTEKLLNTIDPATSQPTITKIYRCDRDFRNKGQLHIGPDLVLGYAKRTRCSNESALGEIPSVVFTDNTDAWSGDHSMDHETVPGILLSSRPLKRPAGDLKELGASILAEFGVAGFPPDTREKRKSKN